MVARILGKCISNVFEFTKAINLMLAMQGKFGKTLEIIKDAGDIDNAMSVKLIDQFEHMARLAKYLQNPKRGEMLAELDAKHPK